MGTYRLDGQAVAAESVTAMVLSMPHRSADGHATWQSGPVGLGHGMLHTTSESLLEKMPLTSPSGRCTIAADARIDNREDLIAELQLEQNERVSTDGELILAAYEKWGEHCVDHLIGDFSFIVWDADQRKLFGARDHFGVRPFFYHYSPEKLFVCASEIKALLTQSDVPQRLNEVRLGECLVGRYADPTHTIYEEIFRLAAGHALTVDDHGLRVRKYYELKPAEDVGSDWSDEAYLERFRDLFEEAVRCRVRSAFPIGSELSGGLDSSYVTCVARDLVKEGDQDPLHTLSAVFDTVSECDERTYIRAVVNQGGVQPHFVPMDDEGPLTRLREIYSVLDDGVVGNNHQITWALRTAAQSAGIRVIVDGYDGDYTVGHGRSYLRSLASAGRWDDFIEQVLLTARLHENADHRQVHEEILSSPGAMLRAYALKDLDDLAEQGKWLPVLKAVRKLSKLTDMSAGFYWKRYLRKLLVPNRLHMLKRKRRERIAGDGAPEVIAREFATRLGLNRSGTPQMAADGDRDEQRRLLTSSGFALSLEIADHYAAAHGIELRHPFLDKRLVEYCLALPLDQSFRNGWTRWIMRRSMESVAPPEIAWRVGKASLRPAFSYGLLKADASPLQETVNNRSKLAGYVDGDAVYNLYEQRHALNIHGLVALSRVATVSALMDAKFGRDGSTHLNRPRAANRTTRNGTSQNERARGQKHIIEFEKQSLSAAVSDGLPY